MRRKLPENVETKPGDNQDERWTHQQRQACWAMYVDHKQGDGMWGRMSALVGKSIKACKAEMWKIHAVGPSGEIYWDKPARLVVSCVNTREARHWTDHENTIVDTAMKAAIPLERLALLLGRSTEAIVKQIAKRRKENRPTLLSLLEEKEPVQKTNHDPEAEARAHPLFPAFEEWAGHNSTITDPMDEDHYVDDWMPSWQCFLAGVKAADKFPKVKE